MFSFTPRPNLRLPAHDNTRYEEAKEYKRENGNVDIPIRYKENKTLGKWTNNQREHYKIFSEVRIATDGDDEAFAAEMKERKCPMTEDRVCLLEEIGFQWSIDRAQLFDDAWNKKFGMLVAFRKEFGHCRVTAKNNAEFPGLAEWVHHQRSEYYEMEKREKEGKTLASERKRGFGDRNPDNVIKARMNRLVAIGFALHVREEEFDSRIAQLKEFKAAKGHVNVPRSYVKNPSLGRWTHAQRVKYGKGDLRADRIKILEDLGFNWSLKVGIVPCLLLCCFHAIRFNLFTSFSRQKLLICPILLPSNAP